MGAGPRRLFISDDRWLLRKPPHMGQGDWWTVERRIYFNQWLQHELRHHLFAACPELGLEATSHQWFDRDTWPEDVEGVYEADDYAEAVDKRLLRASPSLAAQLRHGSRPRGALRRARRPGPGGPRPAGAGRERRAQGRDQPGR